MGYKSKNNLLILYHHNSSNANLRSFDLVAVGKAKNGDDDIEQNSTSRVRWHDRGDEILLLNALENGLGHSSRHKVPKGANINIQADVDVPSNTE